MTDLLLVVGARPNFVKAAPLLAAADQAGLDCTLVHTGQHYDRELSQLLFDDLELPPPAVRLGVGSGSHAAQTSAIMRRFEHALLDADPALVVVVGDVNSTLACGLVAAKEHYPVAHVEAGLRSFDERMPEELNRRLTDHLSQHLFTTCEDANDNLRREGIPDERVILVGNTMIDALARCVGTARERGVLDRFELTPGAYAVATLHRPENVDDPSVLCRLTAALAVVSALVPIVLPLHPRTRERLAASRLLELAPGIVLTPPLGYLDFLALEADAAVVLTDSGGIQEETTALGTPCVTLRDATERPITVTSGTNTLAGTDTTRIVDAALAALGSGRRDAPQLPLWDGHASERIVVRLAEVLGRKAASLAAA